MLVIEFILSQISTQNVPEFPRPHKHWSGIELLILSRLFAVSLKFCDCAVVRWHVLFFTHSVSTFPFPFYQVLLQGPFIFLLFLLFWSCVIRPRAMVLSSLIFCISILYSALYSPRFWREKLIWLFLAQNLSPRRSEHSQLSVLLRQSLSPKPQESSFKWWKL